jgi:hypothetical protein
VADKFEDLRTFVTVMSAGGINAAVTELGIANRQSAAASPTWKSGSACR